MERSVILHGDARVAPSSAAALEQLIRERQAPGLQYAHVDANGVRYSTQLGTADLQREAPVNASTIFHGYSVTKTLTAAAILELDLDLDAHVSTYLRNLPDGRPTLRQILNHTAGYANPIPISWVHPTSASATFDEHAFFERIIATYGHPVRPPGKKFAYSNVGYLVLGEVVRRVSGRPLSRYVEETLIAPLRLTPEQKLRFSFGPHSEHARGYIARWSWLNLLLGFLLDRRSVLTSTVDGWTQFVDLQVDGDAFGGIMGNAAGFARYLQALLRREGPFTPELVGQLFAVGPNKVNLSWFRGALDGQMYFDHPGGGGGFYCELRVYPRLGRASVILLNRSGIRNEHLLDRIDPRLLPEAKRH